MSLLMEIYHSATIIIWSALCSALFFSCKPGLVCVYESPMQVPLTELQARMSRFRARLDSSCPEWEIAVLFGKVNLFYLTGTMQEGMLLIPRNDSATFLGAPQL